MKYRSHGGGTVWDWPTIELEPTMDALRAHMKILHGEALHLMPDLALLEVVPYFQDRKTPDERIGWDDTLLVVLKGYGVMGYVDRMPS